MISYFVRHPVAANLLMAVICVLGIMVVTSIERETFPAFTSDSVSVTVSYSGASAQDVDEEICAPIEDALTGVNGLSDLECISSEGRASAIAELEDGGDIIQFFNDVFSAVSGVNDFPTAAETPRVEVSSREDLVALIAVSGINGKQGLVAYADELADKLLALNGVSKATVSGITDRELQATFNQDALRRYGLDSGDVINAINERSFRQPLGNADLSGGALVLRYSGAQRTIADLEQLIVLEDDDGALVRVADLGRVRMVDSDENLQSYIDGNQAAIISISKADDGDILRIFDSVAEVVDAEKARLPDPFDIAVINNVSENVEERLTVILENIAIGLVLVFVTMWLFFSLREAFWISLALPVSFLGGLFVMAMLGITINMITMVALLMSVGLIMDDSIVIAENIEKWRHKVGPMEAATRGTLEVLPGVFSSFITTACVFGPLLFLSGEFGQILKFIPMVLLITLSLSLLEGFFLLPNHLSHVPAHGAEKRIRPAARALEWFKDKMVLPLAGWLVSVRYLTLGVTIAVFILSIGLIASGSLKVIGFPATEGDTITARVALTSGISRDRTVTTVNQLLDGLARVDAEFTPATENGQPLVKRVLVQYATNSEVTDNGSNTATITVDILESALRNVAADDVLDTWRAAAGPLPDLVQSSFSQSEAGPGGLDLDVEVQGRDLIEVEAAANALLTELLRRPDVTEAFQDLYGGRQELRIELKPYGYTVGLTPQMLAGQLRNAFSGSETDNFREGASNVTVRVQLADTVGSLTDLEAFPIRLPSGEQTSLARVAKLSLTSSYPTITRKNGNIVARVQGKIDRTATTSTAISDVVLNELAPVIALDFPGVELKISGASAEQAESQTSILSAFMLGLIGVYVVLAFQFRSYALPLVVMVAIPFALIGTILGHWALGMDMSMPSFIGFASLAGIVVNNSILFLTFFQSHLEEDNYVAASLAAVRERFRPILLSTATTFVGLVPIIAETSPQVQTLIPLVVAVAFGLLAALVLVVLVFPSLLSIYFDFVSVQKWMEKFNDKEA